MNYLKISGAVVMLILVSACSWGPLNVTHKYGHLPKIYMETPVEDLKFRIYSLDSVNLKLKKKFN
jgi:hypothetical protein